MVQDFSWKTGAVTLYFEVDAADHVVMKSVRSGEVSRDFARPLPLAEIMFAGTGHWIACDSFDSHYCWKGTPVRFI